MALLPALCGTLAAVHTNIAGGTVEELSEGTVHMCLIEIAVVHRRIQQGLGLRRRNILNTVLQLHQLAEQLG